MIEIDAARTFAGAGRRGIAPRTTADVAGKKRLTVKDAKGRLIIDKKGGEAVETDFCI